MSADLDALMRKPEWMELGECRGVDVELMFPTQGESTKAAKAMCRRCEVQAECLAYAMNNGEKFGIWGGLSERERRRLRRGRRINLSVVPGGDAA